MGMYFSNHFMLVSANQKLPVRSCDWHKPIRGLHVLCSCVDDMTQSCDIVSRLNVIHVPSISEASATCRQTCIPNKFTTNNHNHNNNNHHNKNNIKKSWPMLNSLILHFSFLAFETIKAELECPLS